MPVQIIKDSSRELVVKVTKYAGTVDTNTSIVDASTLNGADALATFNELALTNAQWYITGGTLQIIWAGATPSVCANLVGNGSFRYTGGEFILIKNDAVTPTGDVLLTGKDWAATSAYTVILTFTKLSGFNRGGVDSVS